MMTHPSSILKQNGYNELSGAKYGSNKGFDHVIQLDDGTVMILDSKQLKGRQGAARLDKSKNVGVQLNTRAIENVLAHLPDTSPAKQAIETAIRLDKLKTVVIGVKKGESSDDSSISFIPFVAPEFKEK